MLNGVALVDEFDGEDWLLGIEGDCLFDSDGGR
jgi:hypothetical protein